jgi:hypothetical protein
MLMFEIVTQENFSTDSRGFSVRANFVIPVYVHQAYLSNPDSSLMFKSDTYQFRYDFTIQNEALMDYHGGSLVGRQLRQEFLKSFEPMYSTDSIQRAMKVMSDQMDDPAFDCGFLHGQLVSNGLNPNTVLPMLDGKALTKKQFYNDFAQDFVPVGYNTGGFIENNNSKWFERRASAFSTKEIFFQEVKHPVANITYPLRKVIMDLNDNHGWTREQIADWLETLDININMKPKEKLNVN